MSELNRRAMLRLMAAVPFAQALDLPLPAVARAATSARHATQQAAPFVAQFFTPHELRTVTVLADLVIPRDARSGSASDAGVPAFLDFMMIDRPQLQGRMRGGLAWLDTESRRRNGGEFVEATPAQQAAILDDIAWPARAPAALSHGVTFFSFFRDMVATGFWSSQMGVEDLQFMGNRVVPVWNGCPDEALRHLGVRYDD